MLTLVGNLRPYLFNSMLDIPDDIQGRVSASMDVVSEIPALLLSGLIGAASDRLGRRIIYGMGFAILAVGYAMFTFARFDWTLCAMVFITACGASMISAMLSAVIADYPQEISRGKLVGICFFLNGLGVASLVGLASQLPKIFLAQGMTPMEAGRAAYWAVAGLCLIPMVIVLRGLPRRAIFVCGSPTHRPSYRARRSPSSAPSSYCGWCRPVRRRACRPPRPCSAAAASSSSSRSRRRCGP